MKDQMRGKNGNVIGTQAKYKLRQAQKKTCSQNIEKLGPKITQVNHHDTWRPYFNNNDS